MKLRYIYCLAGLLSLGGVLFSSCTDDLEIGKNVDESALSGIYENRGYLCDAVTSKTEQVIELYTSPEYTTSVKVNLTKGFVAQTSMKIAVDEAYLDTYNKEHGTDYVLLPSELVSLDNGGVIQASIEEGMPSLEVKLAVGDRLEAGKTYVLPLAIMENSSDVTIKNETDKHCIYFIRDMRQFGDTYKGEDKLKGYLFFEVNGVNPLNALSFQLENGKYLWDVVVLFAANINYDAEAGRPYVKCNPNVQYLLDNNETLLQPLRKRGMKVLLGLLGNHDMTGLAQLSDQGAKDFAREVAQYCKAYNLDGVNYDDEYSSSPDLDNPSLGPHGPAAAAKLCYETKKAMPDKLVTIFQYGSFRGLPEQVNGVDADQWIDIIVPNYGSSANTVGSIMTKKKCAGLAIEFNLGYGSFGSHTGDQLVKDGYGWFMGFAPSPEKYTSVFNSLNGVGDYYGSPLKEPTIFYKKNDPNPSNYPSDLFN